MSDLGLGRRTSLAMIKAARRAFANTPVQRVPAVGWLYRRTVALAFGAGETTTDFRGLRLTVPGGDHIFTAGLAGGYYEAIELDLLSLLAEDSGLILDVGANIGIHACVAAARLPEHGRLIGFEPVPTNLAYLRSNLTRNGLADRVRVEPLAVGDEVGEMTIHLVAASGNHSLARNVIGASTGTLPVRVTTIDAYLAEAGQPMPVDVLKVDVEGYDGHVLRGAAGLLHTQRPTLFVEYVPNHLTNAGFSTGEFLDLVYGAHEHVYVVDEPRRRVDRCERSQLRRYAGKAVNLNLVAASRPQHVEAIERYRTAPVD